MLAGENNWLGGGQNMQEAILASSAKVTKVMEFTFVVVIKIIRSVVGTRKQENKNITLSDVLPWRCTKVLSTRATITSTHKRLSAAIN